MMSKKKCEGEISVSLIKLIKNYSETSWDFYNLADKETQKNLNTHLTLKSRGGQNPPPQHFLLSQPVVIFSRWNFMTFSFKPCARLKTIF